MKLIAVVLILGLARSYFVNGADDTPVVDENSMPERPEYLTCPQLRERIGGDMLTCNADDSYPSYRCLNTTMCYCLSTEYGQFTSGPHSSVERARVACNRNNSGCSIEINGEMRILPHGDSRLMNLNDVCRTCSCNNGNFSCVPTSCKAVTCEYMGRDYMLDATRLEECYTCRCAEAPNGEGYWSCPDAANCPGTPTQCNCDDEDNEPVCFRGTTYRNRCILNCRDVVVNDLIESGPCREREDPCTSSSCTTPGEVCHRRDIKCLTSRCNQTSCSACEINPSPSQMVCGRDGNSYLSRCHLEMVSPRVHMRYEGACDTTRCPNEPVCGVDGDDYLSRCDAAYLNIRIDYQGRCKKNPTEDDCSSRCSAKYQVKPIKARCSFCGGAVVTAYDPVGLARLIAARSGDASFPQDLDTLEGFSRFVNETTPLIHRLKLLSQCDLSFDLMVDQIMVIYEDRSDSGERAKYGSDAAKILAHYLTQGSLPEASILSTGREMLDSIPSRDVMILSEAAAVMQSSTVALSESELDQGSGSSAAATGVTLGFTLLAAIISFLFNM